MVDQLLMVAVAYVLSNQVAWCIVASIYTIDYVHGIGNRKLTLYIRVRPPMHFLFTFGSWKMAEI
jgi:hypothetical protein